MTPGNPSTTHALGASSRSPGAAAALRPTRRHDATHPGMPRLTKEFR